MFQTKTRDYVLEGHNFNIKYSSGSTTYTDYIDIVNELGPELLNKYLCSVELIASAASEDLRRIAFCLTTGGTNANQTFPLVYANQYASFNNRIIPPKPIHIYEALQFYLRFQWNTSASIDPSIGIYLVTVDKPQSFNPLLKF